MGERLATPQNVVQNLTTPEARESHAAGRTGIPLVDTGLACEGASGPGCLLDSGQRSTLLTLYVGRVNSAETKFMNAVTQHKFAEMIRKEEEVPWWASLLIQTFTNFIVGSFAAKLVELRQAKLNDLTVAMGLGKVSSKAPPAEYKALQYMTPDRLKQAVKRSGDAVANGMSLVAGDVGAVGSSDRTAEAGGAEKATNVGFLSLLEQRAGSDFADLREKAPAGVADDVLISMFHALDPIIHNPDAYRRLIQEKLARYREAGISKFGRRKTGTVDKRDGHIVVGTEREVVRDTRVVWAVYPSGRRELRPQVQDGRVSPAFKQGAPGTGTAAPDFGPSDALGPASLGTPVAAEFVELAIARHVEVWREPPVDVHVDASLPWYAAAVLDTAAAGREFATTREDGGGTSQADTVPRT